MLLIEINFYFEVTANQNVIKSPVLGFSANFDLYVNHLPTDNVDVHFSNTVYFLQILSQFQLLWEAGTKFFQLCIKF